MRRAPTTARPLGSGVARLSAGPVGGRAGAATRTAVATEWTTSRRGVVGLDRGHGGGREVCAGGDVGGPASTPPARSVSAPGPAAPYLPRVEKIKRDAESKKSHQMEVEFPPKVVRSIAGSPGGAKRAMAITGRRNRAAFALTRGR